MKKGLILTVLAILISSTFLSAQSLIVETKSNSYSIIPTLDNLLTLARVSEYSFTSLMEKYGYTEHDSDGTSVDYWNGDGLDTYLNNATVTGFKYVIGRKTVWCYVSAKSITNSRSQCLNNFFRTIRPYYITLDERGGYQIFGFNDSGEAIGVATKNSGDYTFIELWIEGPAKERLQTRRIHSTSNKSYNNSSSTPKSTGPSTRTNKTGTKESGVTSVRVGEKVKLVRKTTGNASFYTRDDQITVTSDGIVRGLKPGVAYVWEQGSSLELHMVNVVSSSTLSSNSFSTQSSWKSGNSESASSSNNTGSHASSSSTASYSDEPRMIDLGLSVKWADRNLGASLPEYNGDFFSWGETSSKTEFKRDNYKWFKDNQYSNPGGLSDLAGSSYDPAKSKLGGTWRMPTEAEIEELITNCTWVWTNSNGVQGYKVTGKNGNHIFLPSNGQSLDNTFTGSYWSSEGSPYAPYFSYMLSFEENSKKCMDELRESFGAIRPVSGSKRSQNTSHKKADEMLAIANQQYNQGDYQGAYGSAEISISLNPSPAAHYLRGFLAIYVTKDIAVAKESLLYCINNGYRTINSRDLYAKTLMDNNEFKEAIQQLELLLNDYPNKDYTYLAAWYNKIHCYSELKDWSKTISEYQKFLEYEGKIAFDYGTVYNNLAWAYLSLNQTSQAISPIQKAIKLNHNRGYIWDTYGEVQYKTGEYEQCVISMTNAIAMYKAEGKEDFDNSYLYRGLAKMKMGNLAGGYVDLEKASDLGNTQAANELKKINAVDIDFSKNGTFKHIVEREITSTYAGNDTKIIRIDLSEESTILYLQHTNDKYETGGYYAISPDAYIRDKTTGKKHLLLTAQNCEISPQQTHIKKGETVTFSLIFPAIPEGASKIDFVESEDSTWKFYNIDLK